MGASPPIEAASLGMADSLILMVLALVVFGPRRLPQIGRQVGKLMFELRKASNDFKFQMEDELRKADEYDRQKEEEARKQALEAQTASSSPAAAAVTPEPAAAAVADPYADAYPAATAETAQTGESAPQILPPSTGETVAAERPGSPAGDAVPGGEPEPASAGDAGTGTAGDTGPAGTGDAGTATTGEASLEINEESHTQEAAAAETLAVTEPADHHG
jgi:sec-independent protein translocase protein TatB